MFLTSSLILRAHVENTVSVDVESHFDLRHTTASGSDTSEVEATDTLVLSSHSAFTLEHVDSHFGLVVLSSRKSLATLARNRSVSLYELSHHATERFDTHRKRSNIKEHDVRYTTFLVEDSTLDSSTHSHHFVRVHALRRSLTEEVLHKFLHSRDTARTTYEDNLIDFVLLETSIAERVLARHETSLDKTVSQLFKFRTSEGLHQVLRHTTYGHDIRKVDFGRSRAREFNLCLLSSFLQTLHCHGVGSEVSTFVVLKFLYQPVDDHLVEVVTTEVSITVCREHFKHTATEFEDRDIESTATKVKHCNLHVLVGLVHTISKCSSRRFIYDTLHFETSDLTSFLSSLTL